MNISRVEYYFAEMLSILEMPSQDEWIVELVPSAWPDDPKHLDQGKLKIAPNVWYIGTINNDDSTFMVTDKVYDRAMPIDINDKGQVFEPTPTEAQDINYSYVRNLFDEAINQYPISEEMIKKFDTLDNFVIKKFKLAFGNRILKQLETFIPVFVGCGGSEVDGFDFIFTNKVLKKFESLNIAFLKDELKELDAQLDKLYGKGNFRMAHNYIEGLLKNN